MAFDVSRRESWRWAVYFIVSPHSYITSNRNMLTLWCHLLGFSVPPIEELLFYHLSPRSVLQAVTNSSWLTASETRVTEPKITVWWLVMIFTSGFCAWQVRHRTTCWSSQKSVAVFRTYKYVPSDDRGGDERDWAKGIEHDTVGVRVLIDESQAIIPFSTY